MFPIRVKTVQESDLRMLGSLARNIQRVLPVAQADIDAAATLGKGWVVWKVFEVSDPLDNLRGGTQLIIRQNSIQPGQNVRRVIFVAGPGGQSVVIRGTDYIALPDVIANSLQYVKAFGGTEQNGTPTPDAPMDIVSNNGVLKLLTSATGTIEVSGTPTPENPVYPKFYTKDNLILRKVGDYADTYDATTKTITRNVKKLVLTGSENWTQNTSPNTFNLNISSDTARGGLDNCPVCTHLIQTDATGRANMPDNSVGVSANSTYNTMWFRRDTCVTLDDWKQWLSDKYAANDPVTVYYPLATAQAESFTDTIVYTDGTVETIAIKNNIFTLVGATYDETIGATGTPGASPNNGYSDYLAVTGGDVYNFSNRGLSGVALYDQNKVFQSRPSVNTGDYTVPAGIAYIRVNFRQSSMNDISITHTNYTATAEMLLKVGDYQDEQEILSGAITRKVGVKVLDGTESWGATNISTYTRLNTTDVIAGAGGPSTVGYCTHYPVIYGNVVGQMYFSTGNKSLQIIETLGTTVAQFKQFLADQYAAGTPVIVVYPLATPTTESVAGQTLQVTDGDNVLEITQASLNGLELEAKYQAAVSLTIEEVQDANLDPNVEVTIN